MSTWTPADRLACVTKRQVHIWRDLEGYEATLTEALVVMRGLLDAQPRHESLVCRNITTDPCACDWCLAWDKGNEMLERWELRP